MVNKFLIVVLTLLAWTSCFAEEGKVVALAGDVSLLRKNVTSKLTAGGSVFLSDRITAGKGAYAQIRLSDQTMLSIGENSALEVARYAFASDRPQEGNALFKLLKGGLRVVTGLIGQQTPQNFNVETVVATIGIRGTHFRLHLCDGNAASTPNCRDGDAAAASGLYGGVSEGRISVGNGAGEMVFGSDEYFYVASASVFPERLMLPPRMLTDRLTLRSGGKGGAASGTKTVAVNDDALSATQRDDAINAFEDRLRLAENALLPRSSGSFVDIGGEGVIRGQIVWLTGADIDLHMQGPVGNELYYSNGSVTLSAGASAQLDHDNTGGVIDVAPDRRVENIKVTGTDIPAGNYRFWAYYYGGSVPTTVQMRVTGDSNRTSLTDSFTLTTSGQNSANYNVGYTPGQAPSYSKQ